MGGSNYTLEQYRRLAELAAEDIIYWHPGDDAPVPSVLLNDTFAPAADSEDVSPEHVTLLYRAWQKFGNHGVTAWAAAVRNSDPMPCYITRDYEQALLWLGEDRKVEPIAHHTGRTASWSPEGLLKHVLEEFEVGNYTFPRLAIVMLNDQDDDYSVFLRTAQLDEPRLIALLVNATAIVQEDLGVIGHDHE